MQSKIWSDIELLSQHVEYCHQCFESVACTSCPLDPPHRGHVACIQESVAYGDMLIVIVNSDEFLIRKKGYAFLPLEDRLAIAASIKGVTDVVAWDDGSQSVAGALAILRPDVFCKGGDRSSPEQMATEELEVCSMIGCRIEFGVGGKEKVQSSSAISERFKQYVLRSN